MTRQDIILAALATAPSAEWSPVQVQKLFFLLDRQAGSALGGPHWAFAPYDYGPFDAAVYSEIETLSAGGLTVVKRPVGSMRTFHLTPQGQVAGQVVLDGLRPEVRKYITDLSAWLRGLSFQQLVSAVYTAYPEMKQNSIFKAR